MSPATAAAATAEKGDHVLLFPFLSKGHTIPLLHLAAALSSRNILVTLVTTPANVPFLRHYLSSFSSAATNVRLVLLPFPCHPDLPAGVESTDGLPTISLFPAFLAATTSLQDPFIRLLRGLLHSSTPPLCLVSDFFLGWTLPICCRFGLPRLVFHGMSAFSMSLSKSLWFNIPTVTAGDEPFPIPGAPPAFRLTMADLPEALRNSVDPLNPQTQFVNSVAETDVKSWGVIVNSFSELEPPEYVELLESFYRPVAGGRAWLVGPLSLLARGEHEEKAECIRWLDRQPDGSIVYVAFGTQASVSDEQLDEVAHGLVRAGVRFLWAVRSETWVPPKGVTDLGRIEREWVPQKEVLGHGAVGGFVSHCGWNSVLEAVGAGVAVLAFPMIAEQLLNAKMVVDEIGVGLRLPLADGLVGRKEVEEGVRELMEGEKGRRAMERAAKLAEKAKVAVVEGGSSYEALEKLLEELRKVPAVAVKKEGFLVKGDQNGVQSYEINCMEEEEGQVELMHKEGQDGFQIAR